ncbi:MAG: ubiquitin-like domain-containing protein [Peptococcaceae bacterium]|nr:ubiquitin-like domain-containing protein [Peptococcaceae bacterium]
MVLAFFKRSPGKGSDINTPPPATTIRPAWIISGLAAIILAAGIVFGFTWAKKTVSLIDNGKEEIIKTRSSSVGELLTERKIALVPEDRVVPDLSAKLSEGARVEIKRAHRITLIADRETSEFYSTADTVGGVLEEKKLALNADDIVKPAAGEKITGDTEIRVIRVNNETEVVKAPVPYDVRRVPNPDMARGISRTVVRGRNGEELQTWRVTYHDGQVVGRHLVDRKVVTNPTEAVVHMGTGQTVSRGGETIRFREAMEVIATAYSHTGYNTATGVRPEYGVVAVDPRVIPLGTRMYVEGYGYATALDTGGAIKGNRIDVFLESPAEASRWGVRTVKVYLLD